jgi:hypothetical protein
MNFLLYYILGCSFAYPISKKLIEQQIFDESLDLHKNQFKDFNKPIIKKIIIYFITLLSWFIVIIFIILKIQLLYYIFLNLFRK